MTRLRQLSACWTISGGATTGQTPSAVTFAKFGSLQSILAGHPTNSGPSTYGGIRSILLHEKKLAPGSAENCVSAFTVSLQTHFEAKKSGVRRSTLPQATSQPAHRAQSGRGDKLIEMTGNRMHCTILMLLYVTGLRRAEASRLKVSDIDSRRMIRLRAP